MQIIFFNVKTQAQNCVDVDDNLFTDMEDIRLLKDGDVYRPISTIPDEVVKLNKLRKEFEDGEFDGLRQTFNYTKKEDIPKTFEKEFSEAADKIIKEKYPELDASMKNREGVLITLSKHFLTYMFTMNRYDAFMEENKKNTLDSSYVLDYAKRFRKLFARENWDNRKTTTDIIQEIDDIRRFMDFDERMHAMYDEALKGASIFIKMLMDVPSDTVKKVGNMKISKDNYGEMYDEIVKTVYVVDRYYAELIDKVKSYARSMTEVDPDKKRAYLLVLKPIVDAYIDEVDRFLSDATKNENVDESARKSVLVKTIEDYYRNLGVTFAAYAMDGREIDKDGGKVLESLWAASDAFRQGKSPTWYLDLGRVLYGSYVTLFGDLLSDEEKARYHEEYIRNGIIKP